MDPESAMAINVPSTLVNWLSTFGESSPLLIHLSTDQGNNCCRVTVGDKSFILCRNSSSCSLFDIDYQSQNAFSCPSFFNCFTCQILKIN